jgi:hypothetical protein
MRKWLLIAGVVAVAVLAIGINRIVVTDGRIDAVVMQPRANGAQIVAFKSDYFPLERSRESGQ